MREVCALCKVQSHFFFFFFGLAMFVDGAWMTGASGDVTMNKCRY